MQTFFPYLSGTCLLCIHCVWIPLALFAFHRLQKCFRPHLTYYTTSRICLFEYKQISLFLPYLPILRLFTSVVRIRCIAMSQDQTRLIHLTFYQYQYQYSFHFISIFLQILYCMLQSFLQIIH